MLGSIVAILQDIRVDVVVQARLGVGTNKMDNQVHFLDQTPAAMVGEYAMIISSFQPSQRLRALLKACGTVALAVHMCT